MAESRFIVPLEFVDVTYEVYCSRVCSHQMVRYRIGTSFIQHSGRFGYYKECGDNSYTFILPRSLIKERRNDIERLFSEIISKYELLTSSKVPLEEARRIIPAVIIRGLNYKRAEEGLGKSYIPREILQKGIFLLYCTQQSISFLTSFIP